MTFTGTRSGDLIVVSFNAAAGPLEPANYL